MNFEVILNWMYIDNYWIQPDSATQGLDFLEKLIIQYVLLFLTLVSN